MRLKVWTMAPGRTFAGEYFIFKALSDNYGQALLAAIEYCEKTRGYKPEKVVEVYEVEAAQERQNS